MEGGNGAEKQIKGLTYALWLIYLLRRPALNADGKPGHSDSDNAVS
jgi:hypothetical protein